jgi:hypothetical protein
MRDSGLLFWIDRNAKPSMLGDSLLPQDDCHADADDWGDYEEAELDCGDDGGLQSVLVADWNEEQGVSAKSTSFLSSVLPSLLFILARSSLPYLHHQSQVSHLASAAALFAHCRMVTFPPTPSAISAPSRTFWRRTAGAACSLAFTQQQSHAALAGRAPALADMALRSFCGWGLLHLGPGAAQPFERNAAAHLLFRVLVGAVHVKFASGFGMPLSMDAGPGDVFVVRPFNFYGMRNTSADGAWAVLYCVHSLQGADAGSGAVEAADEGVDGNGDVGLPAKRRKLHY